MGSKIRGEKGRDKANIGDGGWEIDCERWQTRVAENDCMSGAYWRGGRGRAGDMIGQAGLKEVRVGLTCIRIRQRCEERRGPAAAVAQGASHSPRQDVCVRCTGKILQL